MTSSDPSSETDTAIFSDLATYDVSARRAARLRQRCHSGLSASARPSAAGGTGGLAPPGWIIGQALGGAWCLLYLVEVVRRAAAGL